MRILIVEDDPMIGLRHLAMLDLPLISYANP